MQAQNLFLKSLIPGVDLFTYVFAPSESDDRSFYPLGKKMEIAFAKAIEKDSRYSLINYGLQIPKSGKTIGELDFLIQDHSSNSIIHVELVYKYYLYIPWVGDSELERWIGPNFKDCLTFKLNKLREHQFPVLYHPAAKMALDELGVDVSSIKQALCFCSELYLPFGSEMIPENDIINPECIQGHWMHVQQFYLNENKVSQYHVCEKWEWIIDPDECEDWYGHDLACQKIDLQLKNGHSPMIWNKNDGFISRLFVIPNGQNSAP